MLPTHEISSGGSSFSIVVIRRILDALVDSGGMKKTNLAGKTGLNYPNCVRYIELLEILGWARISDDGTNLIQLTTQGTHFRTVLSSNRRDNRNQNQSLVESDLFVNQIATNRRVRGGQSVKDSSRDNSSYHIMLVDDEPDILLTFKIHLTTEGYNVDAFPDAKSALQNFTSLGPSHYDLIITDIRMKNLNGLQLYHGAKSIDPKVKVIFVTALDASAELVSVLPGVTKKDVFRKPIDEQTFIKVVREALNEATAGASRCAPTPASFINLK